MRKGIKESLHNQFEILFMVNSQRTSGESHELVAGTHVIPRIPCHDIHPALVFQIELLCGIFQTVVETCAACPARQLILVCLDKRVGVCLKSGRGEYD